MKDYYKILGVKKSADVSTIKKAFKELVKKFHPDLNKSPNAHVRFVEINKAYEVLNDQFERIKYNKIYDAQIAKTSKKEKQLVWSFLKYKPVFKKNKILFPVFFILFISTFFYYFKHKTNKKNQLIIENKKKNQKEDIDFKSDAYFKEIEDEIDEDEMQDFANYKNVPELVVNNNSTNKKNVGTIKVPSVQKKKTKNASINSATEVIPLIVENTTKQKEEVGLTKNKNEAKKDEDVKKNSDKDNDEIKVTYDYFEIIGMQHLKGNKYIKPKRRRKMNSFKVNIRLNRFKQVANNKVEVMLLVKNTIGRTLKIDVKEVDFSDQESVYLTFYETLKNKVSIDGDYTFSVFVNKRLIVYKTKRF